LEAAHADLLGAPTVELEHEREVTLLVVGEGVFTPCELLNLGPARHGQKRRACRDGGQDPAAKDRARRHRRRRPGRAETARRLGSPARRTGRARGARPGQDVRVLHPAYASWVLAHAAAGMLGLLVMPVALVTKK